MAAAVQHHGKEMSYNNYLDADAAYGAVCDYAGASLLLDPFWRCGPCAPSCEPAMHYLPRKWWWCKGAPQHGQDGIGA